MNKSELVDVIAKKAGLSKVAAGKALDATTEAIQKELAKAGKPNVTLVGFGTFAVANRAARKGRNPRTGVAITIKAARVPKFRPGKGLRDAVRKTK